jgi:hypothetical protein
VFTQTRFVHSGAGRIGFAVWLTALLAFKRCWYRAVSLAYSSEDSLGIAIVDDLDID